MLRASILARSKERNGLTFHNQISTTKEQTESEWTCNIWTSKLQTSYLLNKYPDHHEQYTQALGLIVHQTPLKHY